MNRAVMEALQPSEKSCGCSPEDDEIFVQHTIDRLVRFGQRVGIGPEDMISLLESGVSVPDLLAFLEWKASARA